MAWRVAWGTSFASSSGVRTSSFLVGLGAALLVVCASPKRATADEASSSSSQPPRKTPPSDQEKSARPEVAWDPGWPVFSVPEFVLTGGLVLGTGAFIFFGKEGEPNWRGPILFDLPIRDALRPNSPVARKNAQLVSNVFYYGGLAAPFVVDVLGAALIAHRSPKVAAQMALIDLEAFSISGFLSFLSNATIRRERSYMRECGPGKPNPVFPDCEVAGQSEGFFSGHTAIAFTGTALTCMHHANLPLYGTSGTGGTIACVGAMGGASAEAVLRLVADKHYATDVIVGAGVGLAAGFIVPWLHYRARPNLTDGATERQAAVQWMPAPLISPTTVGVGALGRF